MLLVYVLMSLSLNIKLNSLIVDFNHSSTGMVMTAVLVSFIVCRVFVTLYDGTLNPSHSLTHSLVLTVSCVKAAEALA